MLYAISQSFNCSLSLKGLILFLFISRDIVVNIFDQRASYFLINNGIIFVLTEGEYIVDVFNKRRRRYGFDSYVCLVGWWKVFTVFLYKKIFIVDEELIELTQVLLFGHFVFYYR